MNEVLNEACVPREGRYIILPARLRIKFLLSEIKAATFLDANGVSPLVTANTPMRFAGFDVYFSECLPSHVDNNTTVYNVLAGLPMAMAFLSDVTLNRVMEDQDNADKVWTSQMVYGHATIYPEALAVGAITVQA
jgi:hypothetical protein